MSHRQFAISCKTIVSAQYRVDHSTLPKPSIFVLHDQCTEELKLIRLLLGNVKITHEDGTSFTQALDFSKMGAPVVTRSSQKAISSQLSAYTLDHEDIEKLLRSTLAQRGYYGELLAEALQFFYRTKRKEHTLAFLHCYRFLEHIAFAFPILYASRTSNFKNAYTALKDFFSGGPAAGELKFFEKFIETSIDQGTRTQSTEIVLNGVDAKFVTGAYEALRRQFEDGSIVSELPGQKFEFKVYALTAACINMRNRFFHFRATDASNLSLNKIGDSDALFSCLNQVLFNWLAVIYFETLKHRVNTVI